MSGFDDYDQVAGGEDAAAEKKLGVFPNPDVKECPVVPLGFEGPRVVFAMPEGEIRKELAAKIGTMLKTDIFACQAGAAFLVNWRDPDDKFVRDFAAMWFVRKCREAGLWDSSRPIRSLGVWPGDATSIVLHVGDEVWRYRVSGEVEKLPVAQALRERRGPLYRLRPPAPRPDGMASAADGLWARDQLDSWRFEPIGEDGLTGADVTAGWVMAAQLGAVAPFRGHLLVNALQGSGKSTLVEFAQALLSAQAGPVIDSFTEAGLRNDLAGMARAVLLDEAEGSPSTHGPGVVERALEMLRRMATGSGGTRKMGDIGGGSITQTAVGAVMLAAINPPRLGPADATRIVEVRLLPLSGSDLEKDVAKPQLVTDLQLAGAIEKAHALAPALLARALAGAWRYKADVAEVKAALLRSGESPRAADLISMLAAGRLLLLSDDPLTPETADEQVDFWRPLLVQRESSEIVSNAGADCLAHLMAADSGLHVRDKRQTIGELLQRWQNNEREYEELLKTLGMRIWETDVRGRPGPFLIVANHHPFLERIFEKTRWADWRRTLSYLDALGPEFKTAATKKQRFGVGVEQRGIAIPLTPWFEKPFRGVVTPGSGGVPTGVPGGDLDWPD
ncbi:hypothetical protein [Phenylobacterium sp.]|uniref:hypothetical protein n=1 Tax=Phenylobacterium sp. TaxID=1871053 RepID=UPI0027325F3A|nr:hypothetical protein [Phenylobacterium sp.]MDP3853165.1 hypothetical protein [Phenylobacterium sp.]